MLIGIGALAFMLWEPHLEGRNARATVFQIYFNDPFLECAYIASIPFFVALYQAFALLGEVGRTGTFSPRPVMAFRKIKYCAIILVGFLSVALGYFVAFVRGQDDIAGGVAICVVLIAVSTIVAATASVLETTLQNTLDARSDDASVLP